MLDVDLAERLGYERPRAIRDLVKSLVRAGKLNDSELCRAERRTAGRPVAAYWLTEEQALLVTTQSATPKAWSLTREIVRVFRLAIRGEPSAPHDDDRILALIAMVRGMEQRLDTLALDAGTISGHQADWITGEIDSIAKMRVMLGYHKTLRAAKAWIQRRVDAAAEWAGTGTKRRNMPAGRYPRVKVCLAQMKIDLEAEAKRRDPSGKRGVAILKQALSERQNGLFDNVTPIDEAKKKRTN